MQTYAIGDIHGHLDKLRAAHDLIEADRARHGERGSMVVHIGDLVDRGPDSRGVIDFLIAGLDADAPWIALLGNHDRMFAGFLSDPNHHDNGLRQDLGWLDPRLGGQATLKSYRIKGTERTSPKDLHGAVRKKVPARHEAFLHRLQPWFLNGEALFVHAGIRPGIGLHEQTEDDLVWIRAPFLNDTRDHGALVVHGHTPVEEPTHYGNRLNIDTGAAYGGSLVPVVIEGRSAWRLTPEGRQLVQPLPASPRRRASTAVPPRQSGHG
jgi:serine/threonine protein phosphatase 1